MVDPEREIRVSTQLVAKDLGIPPRASEIAALLVAGHDLGTIARKKNIDVSTARSHLESIFAKTGVRSQVELVQRIRSGPALLGEPPRGSEARSAGRRYPCWMSVAFEERPATMADLLAIPENERFHEIVGGELLRKAMPSARHGSSQANLTGRLVGPYGRRPGGGSPGGWRFMTETEVRFDESEIYRPDVAAWRRERMPELPREFPITLRPDWVCEILSPSNERNDTVRKMLTYQRAGVPHYWLIDPVDEVLVVHRWTEAGYLLVQSAQRDERIRAEPFDEIAFSVRGLLDGDDA